MSPLTGLGLEFVLDSLASRETGKNWLPKPATGWMPQFALFACAKPGQARVLMRTVEQYNRDVPDAVYPVWYRNSVRAGLVNLATLG